MGWRGWHHGDVGRKGLLDAWDADGPQKTSRREGSSEGGADSIACIGENDPKAHAGGPDPVELAKRDVGLAAGHTLGLGHASAGQALGVARPGVGQEQAQRHWNRDLAPGEGQRDEGLAIGVLAQHRGVLRGDPDRA